MGGNGNLQSFEALVKHSLASDRIAIRALEKMSVFLGQGLRMIASALAPNEIVIVGDITAAWHRFGPIVEAELNRNSLSKSIRLRPAAEGSTARLRSAVALVMNDGL
jgi:predicted NBD/HSP70 family sugar kinase